MVVEVEQQAAGACVSTACAPSLKDVGQAGVDRCTSLSPLLQRDRGLLIGYGEEDGDHLLGSASRSHEFHRRATARDRPDITALTDWA